MRISNRLLLLVLALFLPMFLAYGFATQSHGTLALNSTPRAGTSVGIYLPRSAFPVSAASGAPDAWPVADAVSVDRGTTMLLVEDKALVREAVLAALGKAGFRMLVANSGDAAPAMLESGVHLLAEPYEIGAAVRLLSRSGS